MNQTLCRSRFRRFVILGLLLAAVGAGAIQADDIPARGCFLQLRYQAQIPARESGLLSTMQVEAGDEVQKSQVLASLEDRKARLAVRQAEIDLQVATRRDNDAVKVDVARAALDEASKFTNQARLEEQVSRQAAESDIGVRQTQAANRLATDALTRAQESREKFRTSVSSRELATLKYDVDKSRMDVEQARYDRALLALRAQSASALIEQRESAERRLQLELQDVQLEQQIGRLTVQRMAVALEAAQEQLDRQHIQSPFDGVVVERMRHAGEWVEAGEPVLKVIRLDTLYVDGFVAANLVDASFRGSDVTVTGDTRGGVVRLEGEVVFVSPEVDSVNAQVAIRARIDNEQRLLRPGQAVEMVVHRE